MSKQRVQYPKLASQDLSPSSDAVAGPRCDIHPVTSVSRASSREDLRALDVGRVGIEFARREKRGKDFGRARPRPNSVRPVRRSYSARVGASIATKQARAAWPDRSRAHSSAIELLEDS